MSVEDVVRGMRALDEAAPAYEEAERYYEGCVTEVFADAKVAHKLAKYGASFKANFAKIPVRAIANKLKITSISVPGEDKATDRITEIRELLGLPSEEKVIHRKAGEYGDAFVLVQPVDAEDDPTTIDDDPTIKAGWELNWNSPLCMRVIYDEDHPQRKLYAIKRWRNDKQLWRVRLYYANTIETWITKGKSDGLKPSHWIQDYDYDDEQQALAWPIVTDYGQVPVFHFRNAKPYGVPDHIDAYGPQNGITKILAAQTATIDPAAFKDRWGILEPNAELNANNDDPDADDDTEIGSTNSSTGGQRTKMRSGPGSFTTLPGFKSVGEWSAAEPGSLVSTFEMWLGIMAQVTGIPMKEFRVGGVQPAAEGSRERQLEFNDMITDRQPMYGGEWARIYRFMLRQDEAPIEVESVKVAWDAPGDTDDTDSWSVTQQKLEAGVPARQALSERGYSTDQLDGWKITDDTSPNVVDELVKVAGMAQQLGAAVSLGVLDQASAARYVNAALSAVAEGVSVSQGKLTLPPAASSTASNGSAPAAPSAAEDEVRQASAIRAKADAMGVLIRSGVEDESAAAQVGLTGLKFTGAVPVSLRLPESEAGDLESKGAAGG